ncbi:MAG: AbrB/MazE/SpoVT family DNA-binding domain-containing protein [Methylotenera sp.]|nr:AbrB/MazE/SpoVT family DNA-binding domain-containing protein [Methylotenera sp.]
MLVSLKKWGNSASVRIPSLILESLNLKLDDPLDIKEEDGRIIIAPVKTNIFKLEDLLSAITQENVHSRIDFGASVGKELI